MEASDVQAIEDAAPAREPLPRVWPSIVALVGILPVTALALGFVFVVAALADGVALFSSGGSDALEGWVETLPESLAGVFLLLLPGQLLLLGAALAAASFSRRNWKQRLALDVPPARGKVLAAALIGTLAVAFSHGWLVTLVFPETSESIELLSRMFVEPDGLYGALLVAVAAFVPAVCEELFFRGYAQPRLVARWGGWRGIILPSVFFVLLHFDPQHMLNVLPIGFWLGFVAWRTGSTWTAMLCHAFNNAVMLSLAKLAVVAGDPSELESSTSELDAATVAMSIAGLVVAALSLRVILRNTQPQVHAPKA